MALFNSSSAYQLISVADLPAVDWPGDCNERAWRCFAAQERQHVAQFRRRRPTEEEVEVGVYSAMIDAVRRGPDRGGVEGCIRHFNRVGWERVVERSWQIRNDMSGCWSKDAVRSACDASEGFTVYEHAMLRLQFNDPITWERGASRINSGRHRVCGLRVQCVEFALVVVSYPRSAGT